MSSSESSRDRRADGLNLHKFAAGDLKDAASTDLGQTEFIKRSATEVVADDVDTAASSTAEFGLPVKEMLGVVAYCYVKGVFCSPDIAELLKNDPSLRAKFGRKLPDADAVRRFRRRFAGEIEDVLEDVLRIFPKDRAPGEAAAGGVQREAAELLHDAAWTDNTRGRLT